MTRSIDTDADVGSALAELADQIFAAGAPEQAHRIDAEVDAGAWRQLVESGLTELTGPPDAGGAGAGWDEAAVVLRSLGRHAARVPYAEHDLLAGWLLDVTDGQHRASGSRTVAVFAADTARTSVPWARFADHIVFLIADASGPWHVMIRPVTELTIEPAHNLAGEAHDIVTRPAGLTGASAVPPGTVEHLRLRSALARLLTSSGAAERIVTLTVEHAATRMQFGRPLGRFQAVQHLVADLAAEAALVQTVADVAIRTASVHGFDHPRTALSIEAAAASSSHAVATIVRGAHQVFGAIGYTSEHPLHHYTNRLLSWRSAGASPRELDAALQRAMTAHAPARPVDLWSWLVDSSGRGNVPG